MLTVMRAGSAESQVRVGISDDIEASRIGEDRVIEVGRRVRHHYPARR
jgi:hypothetical protein